MHLHDAEVAKAVHSEVISTSVPDLLSCCMQMSSWS